MSIDTGLIAVIAVLAIGALLSVRAGIRSIQSARTVVFYRTRRARMAAGQQWLAVSFILLIFTVASAIFGKSVAYQIFPEAISTSPTSVWTPMPTQTPPASLTNTNLPEATQTPNETFASPTLSQAAPSASQASSPAIASSTFTSLPAATETLAPTRTASSSTATADLRLAATAATQTARRQAFIAALSATPEATRTPVIWTRTPTNTARPTWTPSPTRTPRPTTTVTSTSTQKPTSTATFTNTPRLTATKTALPVLAPSSTPTLSRASSFTPTRTATSTRTLIPTRTPSLTRTPRPTGTATATYTITFTASSTFTPTATHTATATITTTSTFTPRPTSTTTLTSTPSFTPTSTSTLTSTPTASVTPSPTATVPSSTPTIDRNRLATSAAKTAQMKVFIAALSATPTASRTPRPTLTKTPTFTPAPTRTQTATYTPRPTFTVTPTFTITNTATNTFTLTASRTTQPTTPTRTATLTHTPSFTPSALFTPSRTPTQTPTFTLTPSFTPTPDGNCDRIGFVNDLTVPDNSILAPGSAFTKVWRLRNGGTCTWKTSYRVVLVSGDLLGGQNLMPLPREVRPGESIDLTMTFRAPMTPGSYRGNWQIRDDQGKSFGTTATADLPFWVAIRVATPSATGPTYDFVRNACSAQWSSGSGNLKCPGINNDADGFILPQSASHLEAGTSSTKLSLLTAPQNTFNGYIRGVYPSFKVQQGDHLQAIVGCEDQAISCSVFLRLDYELEDGVVHNLWAFGERYDGKYSSVELDLSSLAGQDVRFVFTVLSFGSAAGDRVLWVEPRIVPKQ